LRDTPLRCEAHPLTIFIAALDVVKGRRGAACPILPTWFLAAGEHSSQCNALLQE
jgi:hypothetical protein